MDLLTHNAISGKLEDSKSAGWLSDYLVAWHGPSGRLLPNVTIWRSEDRSDADVRSHIGRLLAGIVSDSHIEIAGV
jgi:hypothetical protein